MADIEVKMGEIAVDAGKDNLTASGIGSCVVITFYDPKHKTGMMAHTMLPSRNEGQKMREKERRYADIGIRGAKYVDIAIEEMLRMMEAKGAKRKDLEAKIVGGANMFSAFESDIGRDNILEVKEKLKMEGIRILGECVGGSQGRSVEFSLPSGIVTVKTKF